MNRNERFKDAKHPSAELRMEAIQDALRKHDIDVFSTKRFVVQDAVYAVFRLSENFLIRQYYHRDMALEALERGDLDEVKRQLNEIGNSGHTFSDGTPVRG